MALRGGARFRPDRAVLFVGALLVVVFVAVAHLIAFSNRNAAIENAEGLARATATMAREHIARTLEGIDRALMAAGQSYDDFNSGLYGNGEMKLERAYAALRGIHQSDPALRGISWVDANGNRIAQSNARRVVPLNVGTERQFTVHRDRADVGLFINHPIKSSFNDERIILVSRRLGAVDGEFKGVVQAWINHNYIVETYSEAERIGAGTVSLMLDDGTILLQGSKTPETIGTSAAESALFREHLPRRKAGTFYERAPDGTARFVS